MATKKQKESPEYLCQLVVEAMQDKKGYSIVSLDFRSIKNAFCDFFVLCHGSSRVHVETLADSVEAMVKKNLKYNPSHREGKENAEWILLDYTDVVVHVFQEKTRNFFRLEDLWADAIVARYDDVEIDKIPEK